MNKKSALRSKSFKLLPREEQRRIEYVAKNFSKVARYLQLCEKESSNTRAELKQLRESLECSKMPTDEKILAGLVRQCKEMSAEAQMTRRYSKRPARRTSSARDGIDDEPNEYEDAINRAMEHGLNGNQAVLYAETIADAKIMELLAADLAS